MGKYIKRPVVVEAEQYTGMTLAGMCFGCDSNAPLYAHIHTLEGVMRV
jgi:hypothetical protein